MKLEIEPVGSYQKKLNIIVPSSIVKSEFDKAYGRLKRQVQLKGFRKGKVPRRVLESRFVDHVNSEVVQALVQRSYTDALENNEIQPVGRPEVDVAEDIASTSDFKFSILVEVRPDFELNTYTGVEVEFPTSEVDEAEVETAIAQRQASQSSLIAVEGRAVEAGDMVLTALTALVDGEKVVSEVGTMISVDGDYYYPGIEPLLLGMSQGDTKTEEVSFADTCPAAALAGKTSDVTVEIVGIQTHKAPELNDDLATELGYEGGVEGMRAAIRGEMSRSRDAMVRNQARANLLKVIIDDNNFDVPPSMVSNQLEMLLREIKMQKAYQGIDPKTVTFNEEQMADLQARALFATKGGLILEYVSKKENIEVNDADIEAKCQEMADEQGQPVESIRGYFAKEEALDELKDRLLEEKTLEWLLENAQILGGKKKKLAASKKASTAKKAAAEDVDLSKMSAKDLKAIAKERGLKGYSSMKKSELVDLLK